MTLSHSQSIGTSVVFVFLIRNRLSEPLFGGIWLCFYMLSSRDSMEHMAFEMENSSEMYRYISRHK